MKEVELYPKRQGRPYIPSVAGIDNTGYGAHSWFSEGALGNLYRAIYFHHGNIDGGDIGEPTPAMDYLDYNLDGGVM